MKTHVVCALGLTLGVVSPAPAAEPATIALRPVEGYGAVQAEFQEALTKWLDEYRQADEGARDEVFARHPAREFFPRFEALANGGEPRAIVWLLQNLAPGGVPPEELGAAALPWVERLVRDHRESDAFADGLDQLAAYSEAIGFERSRELLETAMNETQRRKNRAHAIVALGDLWADQPGDAAEAKARAYFQRAIDEYDDTAAGERAVNLLRGLAVRPGKPAPDFEARTVDGHAFQLSDYRGKVVLLDFYGFW